MQDDNKTMKEKLLQTTDGLQEHGVDLSETPALFRWSYDEKPDILYQLMISDVSILEDEGPDGSLH